MKIVTKKQMQKLMEEYPDGGIVFIGYTPDVTHGEIKVTEGEFRAKTVVPWHGEVYNFDWDIQEYSEDNLFMVFDNNDVLQMIQTLTRGLKINLEADYGLY